MKDSPVKISLEEANSDMKLSKKKNKTKTKKDVESLAKSFIEDNGYYMESHEVETEDGYILTLMRLRKKKKKDEITNGEEDRGTNKIDIDPYDKTKGVVEEEGVVSSSESESGENGQRKPVALFVHGLMCKGEHWCMIKPEDGLPYQLVDEGYDCWIANLRGTPHSRKHVNLPTDSKEYWNFSFHELGIFDLPSILNFILDTTRTSTLSYVGHSMGCAILFVMLSMKPEYSSKINVMVALAPPVYGKHIRKVLFRMCILGGNLVGLSSFLRNREMGDATAADVVKPLTSRTYRDKLGGWMMLTSGRIMGAFGPSGIEKERVRKLCREWPCPTSIKLFCHGLQCFHANKARQYNYGRAGNLKAYGSEKPPVYDLGKVNVPVAVFHSKGDELCRPEDVGRIIKELPNVIYQSCIEDEGFSHVDFMLGIQANKLVYKDVIPIIRKYGEEGNNDTSVNLIET